MLRFPDPDPRTGVESSPPSQAANPQVAPDPLVWNRTCRGSEPRYWDTVSSGDAIPDLPKGTYTTTELYLFSHSALSTRRARYVDEGTIDMGAGGRADPEYARKARAQSSSFDFGPQRMLAHPSGHRLDGRPRHAGAHRGAAVPAKYTPSPGTTTPATASARSSTT
jgi:hypothetical protein